MPHASAYELLLEQEMKESLPNGSERKPLVPDTPEFRELIRGMSLGLPEDGAYDTALDQRTPTGLFVAGRQPNLPLCAPRVGKVSLDWLIGATRRELRAAGHVDTYEAARLLLSLYVFHAERQRNPIGGLVEFIRCVKPCRVNQYFVSPTPLSMKFRAQVGPFLIGNLDVERFGYQLKSAGVDIEEDAPTADQFAIAHEGRTVPILPATTPARMGFRRDLGQEAREVALVVVDDYFTELATEMFERFWLELRDAQLLTASLGAAFIDGRFFRERAHGSKLISIFWKFGKVGWAKVQGQGWAVDLSSVTAVAAKDAELRPLLEGRDVSEFTHVANVFGQLIVRGREHEIDGRVDEAFLSHVIALDTVFGVKDESTRSVAERVATLIGGGTHDEAKRKKKRLQVLYDARSGYVHQGHQCDPSLLDEVKGVCQDVALALLRITRLPATERPRSVEQWLTRLDAVWKAGEADMLVDQNDLRQLGVQRPANR